MLSFSVCFGGSIIWIDAIWIDAIMKKNLATPIKTTSLSDSMDIMEFATVKMVDEDTGEIHWMTVIYRNGKIWLQREFGTEEDAMRCTKHMKVWAERKSVEYFLAMGVTDTKQ